MVSTGNHVTQPYQQTYQQPTLNYALKKIGSLNNTTIVSSPNVDNLLPSSWHVINVNEKYFTDNDIHMDVSVTLTHSREDVSCLQPGENERAIILFSSLRYQLKHYVKVSPKSSTTSAPQLLYMTVDLEGGKTKEEIKGVISPQVKNVTCPIFASESRIQIEKVPSYKQSVHFKISFFDLHDLETPICVMTSVDFNVFARKKQTQDGVVTPPKKQKNPAIKRNYTEGDSIEFKRQKFVESTYTTNNNLFGDPSSLLHTITSEVKNLIKDPQLVSSLVENAINEEDDEDEDETHTLKIDDEESEREVLLEKYGNLLSEMMTSIHNLSGAEKAQAIQMAVQALQ